MDPFSHSLLGAATAQILAKSGNIRRAAAIGLLSAMAPDLDVLISSADNPLLSIIYHRQFTHSLVFIPFAAFLLAPIFWLLFRKKMSFLEIYILCFAAYGTHCFLDSATSYGTHLLWPFSNIRISWDIIAIIDPVVTILLLIAVLSGIFTRDYSPVVFFFSLTMIYFGFGAYQHAMAKKEIKQVAISRQHRIEHIRVLPSFANLILWRTVYVAGGNMHFDAIRTIPFMPTKLYSGSQVKHLKLTDLKNIEPNSVAYEDVKYFAHFADGFIGPIADDSNAIGDYRYSLLPNDNKPIWGVKYNPATPDKHVEFIRIGGKRTEKLPEFIEMLKGK